MKHSGLQLPLRMLCSWTALTFITGILVTSAPTNTLAQKPLPYLQQLNIASHLAARAKEGVELNDYSTVEDDIREIEKGLLRLFLPQTQSAVLQSVQDLSGAADSSTVIFGGDSLLEGLAAVGEELAAPFVASQMCSNHTVAMIEGLLSWTPWAVQMLDAMGKPSPAITDLNFNWPGAYEQCQNVRANTTVLLHPHFSGQYCSIIFPIAPASTFLIFSQPIQITLGACVPDTCTSNDLNILYYTMLFRLNITGPQLYFMCIEPPTDLDTRAIIAITICSFFLLFILLGTAIDIWYVQRPKWMAEENTYIVTNGYGPIGETTPLIGKPNTAVQPARLGTGTKMLIAFSVYTNGAKLLSTNKVPGSLDCVHGVRFLSMTWVVLGHSILIPALFGGTNIVPFMKDVTKRWTFQAILNASVSVDSFFALSGLLVAYLSLREMKKRSGKLNWFLFYFHRFWRLTPVYMMVIMIVVCLSPYWGEGPFWFGSPDGNEACENNWWTNLLYINNFVKADVLCLGQTWYLANDMQFYILSPLIFVPLFFKPWLGMVVASIFLLVTSIVPGVLTSQHRYIPYTGNSTDTQDYMVDFYIKPYVRMGPYVVGMLAGYFLYATDCKLRINKIANLSLWAVATGTALAILYGLYDHSVSLHEAALWNAVCRHLWGACVAWVVVACVTGNGGFINTILSWPALIPLSRLTYTIYLIHMLILQLYIMNRRTIFYVDDINNVVFFLGILVVCYMAAAVTSLAFEAPMMGLEKVLFHSSAKPANPQDNRADDKKDDGQSSRA